MFQIQTKNKISKAGLIKLPTDRYTIADEIEAPDAILVRSANLNETDFNPELLCIARAGAGVNNIPVDRCAESGIVVFNTPGANANAVKELVLCAMLLASRKISQGIAWTKNLAGEGAEISKLVEKGKSQFVGPELRGKKLGVIGLGAIGVMVANTAVHLGMEVYGYDPYLSVDVAWNLSRHIAHATDLATIFKECDYITLHVPATEETRGVICKANIETMKDGVRIINLARGDLVVSQDVVAAIESGKMGAYVTDFADEILLACDGVVAMPHLGASTPESEDNCAEMAARELRDYLERGVIRNSVNFPNVIQPKTTAYRICVLHQNIPKMVNNISGMLAETNINIEHMINNSKKNNACTFMDVEVAPGAEAIAKLQALPGIYRVRVIGE